jgi:DNA-binding response OmpR family regulator
VPKSSHHNLTPSWLSFILPQEKLMTSILLVDDELMSADSLAFNLRRDGYEVHTASDGTEALEAFDTIHPDLLILDVRMPGPDGYEVCRRVRARSSVPIIMLTALDDELDRVVGLEIGADDYIAKPFSYRELLARIRSILRRVELDQSTSPKDVFQVNNLRLDVSSRRVFKNDDELQLSAREFDLLMTLMSNAGRAVSRNELISQVWGPDWSGDPRTLEVHIRWLRLKIEDDATTPQFVHTVRGFGYRFAGPEE